MRRTALLAPVFAASLVACGGPKAPSSSTAFEGPAVARTSTSKERTSVAVTIYNGSNASPSAGFGLVREVRELGLGAGKVSLEFRDVAAHIQPETVHIKSLDDAAALTVFEQNYRYDLLTPAKLLEKYVGKKVRVYRWNEKLGAEQGYDAEVLSVEGESPVLKIGDEITYGFPGRLAFPNVPPNLIAKPTLVWLLGSARDKQRVEVSYLTSQMGWRADYVLVLAPDGTPKGDLTGWVTLDNRSGTEFADAQLKLVAGDVNKIVQASGGEVLDDLEETTLAKKDEAGFQEEGFFEYHLYTLGRPTTLLQNEQKQVTLLEAQGVKVDEKLVFVGASWWYRGKYGQVVSNQKVSVFLELENAQKYGLGMPLPKGIVRVYKADKSSSRQFIGEDAIDHTPRDEKLKVKMGEAFDVVGDRVQQSWTALGGCTSETSWEISLRNHKDVPVEVEVVEPIGGDWEIVNSSLPAKKKDAHTFSFDAKVPANGETKIAYRVRVRWC